MRTPCTPADLNGLDRKFVDPLVVDKTVRVARERSNNIHSRVI